MKRDVSVVFSASYVAHGIRLLIYVLYNLKAWGDSVCRFIMFQVTENKGGKWHTTFGVYVQFGQVLHGISVL